MSVTPMRVVILGGGFAGISAALELGRLTRADQTVEVHLVNNENYFVFQPLLPEVVSCDIEPTHILNPIRLLCPDVHFHCAAVDEVDLAGRIVALVGSDERRVRTLPYDHLIWCLGLKMDLSKVPGMTEHAFPLKTLGDAFELRNHIVGLLEEAELEEDTLLRQQLLTVVTVGGGFSGVETAAAINDMIKSVLPLYPRARASGCRSVLAHSGERILQDLDSALSVFAQGKLRARGVEVLLKTRVSEATAAGVTLSTGHSIAAGTVVCTIGSRQQDLVHRLKLPIEHGRIVVDDFMKVPGSHNMWAIGDAARVPNLTTGIPCPPTAQYAIMQGVQCARNVLAAIRGRSLSPFRYAERGQLAAVGRHSGVGRVMGVKVSGPLAWYLWRSVYWMKLPGLRCKVRVGIDWLLELLFPRDITKIELHRTETLKRAHFSQGEVIVRQGEIGDRFYIIQSGQVEVVQREGTDEEQRLAVLSVGESFGEIALLQNIPRTATVRCLTPVDVLILSRRDFQSLVRGFNLFRDHFRKVSSVQQGAPDPSKEESVH